MIKIEKIETYGWDHAIRGMRNPLNSWDKSDSASCALTDCEECPFSETSCKNVPYIIGPNDMKLMKQLAKAGSSHRKYLRMITVYADITAPLYWWKEFDTYKVGTVANSCSTMHKIADKEFTLEDFSCEKLIWDDPDELLDYSEELNDITHYHYKNALIHTIEALNSARNHYILAQNKPMKEESKRSELVKKYWWQMITLLPSSYNQKRTVMLNYEVLTNMYHDRKYHKLDEWVGFCKWIETLPYSELITGGDDDARE